jgi:heterotetrameric sarcosine oxidase gamma subunit
MSEPAVQIVPIGDQAVVQLKSWAPALASTSLVPPELGGQMRILPLGPGEWLAVSDTIEAHRLHACLERHVEAESIAAVDLSCGIKSIRVEGSAARALLAKGCGLDLHPNCFPEGRATRTRFAQLAVIVECFDSPSRFNLYVGRSYFAYLQVWLKDAATEFVGDTASAFAGCDGIEQNVTAS